MDEEIRNLLSEEIKTEIEDLSSLDPGSKEKSQAIENLATLYRLKIEESKADWDADEKYNRRIMEENQQSVENAQKSEQLSEQVKDRYFRVGIAAAEIVLPLAFYALWMKKGFKFEETGTYTSTTFRGLFSRFRPTKK